MRTRREVIAALSMIPFARSKQLRGGGLRLNVIRNGRSNRCYLHIHGDESTARDALVAHIKKNGGVAFLVDNDQRNIARGVLRFDPNRVWSHVGALANIDKLNPRISWAERLFLIEGLDRDREKLLSAILPPAGGLLLALHNNANGYSVQDEVAISDKISLADEANPHEFFLCTSKPDYQVLSKSPYNVVLQNRAPPMDDGSFSRLAAKLGVRYVNLEVGLGNRDRQVEMLNWAEKNLA